MWYNCVVWFEITAANRSSVPKSKESRQNCCCQSEIREGYCRAQISWPLRLGGIVIQQGKECNIFGNVYRL